MPPTPDPDAPDPADPAAAGLGILRGEVVVLDLAAPWVYLGTLKSWDPVHLVLADADAHDLRDTSTTREMYVLEAARHGVAPNRRRVLVRRDAVVALGRLADVLT